MEEPPEGEITALLVRWQHGDANALEALIPLVYQDLRRVAKRHLAHERPGQLVFSDGIATAGDEESVLAEGTHDEEPWAPIPSLVASIFRVMRRRSGIPRSPQYCATTR